MTIKEAFEQVIASSTFKEKAKSKDGIGGHYRLLRSRYKRGILKNGAMVEILLEYGYIVTVNKDNPLY